MPSSPKTLVGPPFLYRNAAAAATTTTTTTTTTTNLIPGEPLVSNPCLDYFLSDPTDIDLDYPTHENIHYFLSDPHPTLKNLFKQSLKHDPLTTFKILLFHRRFDAQESFFQAVLLLHETRPVTLACNIRTIANLGCIKDLLEILYRVLMINEERMIVEDRISMAKRALEKYYSDANYRFLHNRVSDYLAELLGSDLMFLKVAEVGKISMAAKHCPSVDSLYDKSTLICEAIARKLFPQELNEEYKEIEEARYAFRVRKRLQKKVLGPLCKALISRSGENSSTGGLNKLEPDLIRVYSSNYKELLSWNDDQRFRAWLEIADYSCKYTNFRSMLDRFGSFWSGTTTPEETAILELQWPKFVAGMSENGRWKHCITMCHVSEKMEGTTAEYFSIAMSLLFAELNQGPWKGKVLTFEQEPKLREIEGDTLKSKFDFIRKLEKGKNFRFSKLFDQILETGISEKLEDEAMVKKVFVITDIPMNEAVNSLWGIWASEAQFMSKGYSNLPEIVYWDIGKVVSMPEKLKHKGMAMVKGFSTCFAAAMLESGQFLTLEEVESLARKPEDVMKLAISGEEFEDVVVVD